MQKRIYKRASISGCHEVKCNSRDAKYRPEKDEIHVPCCSTTNRVMDLASRIGYKKVFLLGFDGSNDYYYTDKKHVPNGPDKSVPTWALEAEVIDKTAPKADVSGGLVKDHNHVGADLFMKAFAAFNGFKIYDSNPRSKMISDGAKVMSLDNILDEFEHGCHRLLVSNFDT